RTLLDNNKDAREDTAAAIIKTGLAGDAVEIFVRALRDERADVKILALKKLAELGDKNDNVVTSLIVSYGGSDEKVSEAAFETLTKLGIGSSDLLGRVLNASRENRIEFRPALGALARLGNHDEKLVVPLLVKEMADPKMATLLRRVLCRLTCSGFCGQS